MISFFKRLFRSFIDFFDFQKKLAAEPTLYFDTYIRFKKAPLIGKLYQHRNKIWRVVGYKKDGNFKCELELISK